MLAVTLLLLLVAVLASDGMNVRQDEPIVHTPNGPVQGKVSHVSGRVVEEYLGIPFAVPPEGDLRFRKPLPVEPWTEVVNATEFSPHCTHMLAFGYPVVGISGENGEDCLYVNVWVPDGVSANEGKKLPVMVFIYGGGYQIGTGEMYPVNGLAAHGDVIGVNFNYRISVLGWLTTGDEEAPGNYGLWDIKLALEWVQTNIESFSGDPTRVTIFGQSAGANAVSNCVVSPLTNSLFHSAISISGSASRSSRGLLRDPMITTNMLAQLVECPTDDPHSTILFARARRPLPDVLGHHRRVHVRSVRNISADLRRRFHAETSSGGLRDGRRTTHQLHERLYVPGLGRFYDQQRSRDTDARNGRHQ